MPNIEIHGLFWRGITKSELRNKIWRLFDGKPFQADMVVSEIATDVSDVRGTEQPFLRLVSTLSPHTEEIMAQLETLNMDIEWLELKKFVPKRE